jgi:hypothetical protein
MRAAFVPTSEPRYQAANFGDTPALIVAGVNVSTWHLMAGGEVSAFVDIPRGGHTYALIPLGRPVRPSDPCADGPSSN